MRSCERRHAKRRPPGRCHSGFCPLRGSIGKFRRCHRRGTGSFRKKAAERQGRRGAVVRTLSYPQTSRLRDYRGRVHDFLSYPKASSRSRTSRSADRNRMGFQPYRRAAVTFRSESSISTMCSGSTARLRAAVSKSSTSGLVAPSSQEKRIGLNASNISGR